MRLPRRQKDAKGQTLHETIRTVKKIPPTLSVKEHLLVCSESQLIYQQERRFAVSYFTYIAKQLNYRILKHIQCPAGHEVSWTIGWRTAMETYFGAPQHALVTEKWSLANLWEPVRWQSDQVAWLTIVRPGLTSQFGALGSQCWRFLTRMKQVSSASVVS